MSASAAPGPSPPTTATRTSTGNNRKPTSCIASSAWSYTRPIRATSLCLTFLALATAVVAVRVFYTRWELLRHAYLVLPEFRHTVIQFIHDHLHAQPQHRLSEALKNRD